MVLHGSSGVTPFGLKWDPNNQTTLRASLQAFAGGSTFFSFDWCQVEPTEGHRDWTRVDTAVRDAQALGYTPMLKIRTGSCWATAVSDAPKQGRNQRSISSLPRDLSQYAAFVTAVVDRYAPLGVHSYALENEVNARTSWAGTAAEYLDLVEAGAPAVHKADPEAVVLDGGLSSIGYGAVVTAAINRTDPAAALDFYRALFARRFANKGFVFPEAKTTADITKMLAGVPARQSLAMQAVTVELTRRKLIDAYQLHYYEPAALFPQVLSTIRSEIGATPIQAWEVGVAWPGADYDMRRQADEVAMLGVDTLRAGIQPVVYLPLAFSPGGTRDHEIWRGLVDPDGATRPAAAAYQQLQTATAGRPTWQPLDDGSLTGVTISGAAISGKAPSTVIAWSKNATAPVAPPAGWTAEDAAGNHLRWDTAHELSVGADPVFMTGPGAAAPLLAQLDRGAHS